MANNTNKTGLYRELIIHPGETIAELLQDRGMSQKELALRTGVSPKHVSKVVNGQASISAAFAKKLEYAFGISSDFWQNLQANYDRELQEYEEYHSVSSEEIFLVETHKDLVRKLETEHYIEEDEDIVVVVLNLRMFLGLSNLCHAGELATTVSPGTSPEEDAFVVLVTLRCQEH